MSVVNLMKEKSKTTGRSSPSIWGDCPINELKNYPEKGLYFFEDFHDGIPSAHEKSNGLWYYVVATSAATKIKDNNGLINFAMSGTGGQGCTYSTGGNVSGITKLTSKQAGGWWYEARVRVTTIGNADHGIFVGLAEEALSGASDILTNDTPTLADKDLLGFYTKAADGDELVHVVKKEGETAVEKVIATLAANTYVQLGYRYRRDRNELHVFIDGEHVHTIDLTIDAFPSGQDLALYLVARSLDGNASALQVDWVAHGYTHK